MAAKKAGKEQILAHFFDDGAYTWLFADGAVSAAYGCAMGQSAYAVCQNGGPVGVKDIDKAVRVLEMAAETGTPVVTFYDSTGAKLEGGLDLLNANARLMAEIAKISGVVPQIAVVTGTCAGSSSICAAAADLCIVADDAELFLTSPFNSEDKVEGAGSEAFAAKAGVAAAHTANADEAARLAARLVGMLPGNNLAGPSVFDFAEPKASLNLAKYLPAEAASALADEDSLVELYGGYGKNVYTALATIGGSTAGIVVTAKEGLDHRCTAKAARFVRFCDAYSIPVVTVVNTEGLVKSEADDQAGGIRQAARMAGVYAEATTVKVAVLAGEAVGPVYTVFAAPADWRIAVPAAPLPRWRRRLPQVSCIRRKSTPPTMLLRPQKRKLLPTARKFALPRRLLPPVLLIPFPPLLTSVRPLCRHWICWPANARCVWPRSMAILRCNFSLPIF